MRGFSAALLAGASLVFVASGCQHLPPQPLDLAATGAALQARQIDVEPVRAYADALAAVSTADPTSFGVSDGLSLTEAQAIALWYNPSLRIARLEAEQARATAQAAGRWADPELGFETGEKSVDAEAGGFLRDAGDTTRSWISAPSLSITIPLSGRLGAEKRLSRSMQEVAQLRAVEAEQRLLTELRDAWSRWTATRQRISLLDEHLALLARFTGPADALATAGEVAPSGARLFRIESLRKDAERAREQAAEAEQRAGLLELMGLVPEAPVELLPTLSTESPAEAEPIETHPALLRAAAEYRAAEDQLRVELRKQYPDLTLSPTYTDEGDETSLVVGMGFPLPVWNANREGIAAAVAARDLARARAEAEYRQLLAERAKAQAALEGSRAQRERLLEGVVPVIDAQVSESLALLEVGELDIVVLHEALTQALETKLELLDAILAEAIAASRLRAATASQLPVIEIDAETIR